ncbi:MAG: ATP-dependent zinc metalloprotease FtsH [Patescibacteria group bacterium]|nr:MAG: ATP-dependent zinc metalloprotease FtsH [Patescibacteria group bacterium]
MKLFLKNFLLIVFCFIFLGVLFSLIGNNRQEPDKTDLASLVSNIKEDKVESVEVRADELFIKLRDGQEQTALKETGQALTELLANYGVTAEEMSSLSITVEAPTGASVWLGTLLPFLFPVLLLGLFLFLMYRSVQGSNSKAMMFGQSQAREVNLQSPKDKITFNDVAGVREAKEELGEVVDFLKYPNKFTELGAKIPRGVLLLGSPGTGKTLLARAVAGEANVPFFSISGSEFVEMFVGVGASRVRDLFRKAKRSAPCIIFIDEIDAVGRKRGTGVGGSHDEREQTLNQILVEMDGFEVNAGVIVMAATNRPDVLDAALLRPGRFDRQVVLDEPDINDREAILKIHSRQKPLDKEVALRKIAERTPGFSGADLANALNEAALLAARRGRKVILMEDLFDSIEKVMLGPERRSRILSPKEKEITAYHEAGHALVAHKSPRADDVHKVSIIARGRAGGYTLKLPSEDKHLHTKSDFIEEIAVLLGGYMAEKNVYGEVTTGATSDLRRATVLARRLITDYGMSENLGPRTFGDKEEAGYLGKSDYEARDYSEKTAEEIDKEISGFIDMGMKKAEEIIIKYRDDLQKITDKLLEKETIEQEEFLALMNDRKTEEKAKDKDGDSEE